MKKYNCPPILILTFNRPDLTKKLLIVLSKIKPNNIFFASDGPREHIKSDMNNVNKTRGLIRLINWSCDVKTLFNDKNLGCAKSVHQAIDWFFENVDQGIILEDDCIPDETFFTFSSEMLKKYRNHKKIMAIGGQCFNHKTLKITNKESYQFSGYIFCWGWATWRRAWRNFDFNMRRWNDLSAQKILQTRGNNSILFSMYWTRIFNDLYENKINSWAYRWLYSCWMNNGISIIPNANLVQNIGFRNDATHTSKGNKFTENLPLQKLVLPIRHPKKISIDIKNDLWLSKNIYGITAYSILKEIIFNLLKRLINR